MALPYSIPAKALIAETVINRSRFICYLFACDSSIEVKQCIARVKEEHPQARHHCYAFIYGRPEYSQSYGFSDDGEPSGTAGQPMLMALQGSNLGEVCAVVVRYFGGIKLGTGGLQRAYGGSVRDALTLLDTKTKIPMVHRRLACQYNQVDDVLYILALWGGEVIEQRYQENVQFILSLPEEKEENFSSQLTSQFSGQLQLKKTL